MGLAEVVLEERHGRQWLALAVPGIELADLELATGLTDFGRDLGVHPHVHSTWLARNLTEHCHWRDDEGGLMWLVTPTL